MIEVLILDLTIDEDTLAGISWALQGSSGNTTATGGVRRSTGSLGDSIGSATATLLQGGSFFVGNPDNLFFLLRAFAADSKVDIISNPILMTLDNQPASISITQEIPVLSATLESNSATSVISNEIEFRSVGVKLDILPQINSDNFVFLKIDQEISSVGPLVPTGDTTTPSFNTRFLSTQVVIEDNQVLIMGGLMENRKSISNEGVPGLKDLPMIGYLFGSDTIEKSKTELMLFLIPHVISSPEDSIRITREFKHRLGQFQHLADEVEK
jgi:general secretion pathway protein D